MITNKYKSVVPEFSYFLGIPLIIKISDYTEEMWPEALEFSCFSYDIIPLNSHFSIELLIFHGKLMKNFLQNSEKFSVLFAKFLFF